MAQTPVSVSVNIAGGSSSTASTIYTVPVGKTAVVRGLSALASTGGGAQIYISKSISGQSYPIVYAQSSAYSAATGATTQNQANLLPEPITMAAGEILQTSTDTVGTYNIPSVSTAPTTAADGTTAYIQQILYGNSIYMAVGYSTTGAYVATSSDCITWTQRTAAASVSARFDYVAYTNSIWVAIYQSQSSAVYYSTDNGVSWTVSSGMSGIAPNCVYSGNNQFLITGSNGRVYYSTNGNTWTEFSAFYSNAGGYTIRGAGWSGSHWLINTNYGTIATNNLSTAYYYGGINNGASVTSYKSIEYSPAYSKYYAVRATMGVINVFSSSEGLLWTNVGTISLITPYKVACAGSNTVLIVAPENGTSSRYVSTDGTNFSLSSDIRGYAGGVWGLANGYFLTFRTDTNDDAYYVSTNPTSSTGTAGGSSNAFSARSAAADPVTGKYCCIGINTGANQWAVVGGNTATATSTMTNTGISIDSTIGNPISICWSAVDGYFYVLSDTGQVWRSTAYNASWSQVSSGIGVAYYNSNYAWTIRAVGTTLYAATQGSSSTIFVGSTLTGGASWTSVDLSSQYSGYYQPVALSRSGIYFEGCGATNGSYFLIMTNYGTCTIWDPSGVRTNIVSPPSAGGNLQTMNGYTFMYGGNNRSTGTAGVFWSTNVITTYGSYFKFQGYQIGGINKPAMFMTYIGGTYYVNNIYSSGSMFSSSNLLTWTGKGVGTSMCGVPVVNISGGFAIDGTNMVSWQYNSNPSNIVKTSTPQNYVYAATVTASVVEIS